MGQILHGSAKPTHAVRADASIQNNSGLSQGRPGLSMAI